MLLNSHCNGNVRCGFFQIATLLQVLFVRFPHSTFPLSSFALLLFSILSMSTEEKKDEIPPEENKETQDGPKENNPYVILLQQRIRNITKRLGKAEANKSLNSKELDLNQRRTIEEIPSMKACIKEFEDFIPLFRQIEDAQAKIRAQEIEKNVAAIFALLLLPSYVKGEDSHISAEQSQVISQLHEFLLPENVEKDFRDAVAERVEFVGKLLMESEEESFLKTPFTELIKLLNSFAKLSIPAPSPAKSEPTRKPEKKRKQPQQAPKQPQPPAEPPKQTPAEQPAPAPVPEPAPASAPVETAQPAPAPEEPPKAEPAPAATQEPEKKEPAKEEEKPTSQPAPQRGRRTGGPKGKSNQLRYVPNKNGNAQEAPVTKEEPKKEERKPRTQQKNQKQAQDGVDPFRYSPKS